MTCQSISTAISGGIERPGTIYPTSIWVNQHCNVLLHMGRPVLQFFCTSCCVSIGSCMAVSDLLVGQLVSEVAGHLPSLWELCLRARDDIKVRGHCV